MSPNHIFDFLVDFPLFDQRSITIFAPPGVLIQTPQLPNHHIAKLFLGTTSSSISSLSQVPHSGKVFKIHDSRVMSLTLAILFPPICIVTLFIYNNSIV